MDGKSIEQITLKSQLYKYTACTNSADNTQNKKYPTHQPRYKSVIVIDVIMIRHTIIDITFHTNTVFNTALPTPSPITQPEHNSPDTTFTDTATTHRLAPTLTLSQEDIRGDTYVLGQWLCEFAVSHRVDAQLVDDLPLDRVFWIHLPHPRLIALTYDTGQRLHGHASMITPWWHGHTTTSPTPGS